MNTPRPRKGLCKNCKETKTVQPTWVAGVDARSPTSTWPKLCASCRRDYNYTEWD